MKSPYQGKFLCDGKHAEELLVLEAPEEPAALMADLSSFGNASGRAGWLCRDADSGNSTSDKCCIGELPLSHVVTTLPESPAFACSPPTSAAVNAVDALKLKPAIVAARSLPVPTTTTWGAAASADASSGTNESEAEPPVGVAWAKLRTELGVDDIAAKRAPSNGNKRSTSG